MTEGIASAKTCSYFFIDLETEDHSGLGIVIWNRGDGIRSDHIGTCITWHGSWVLF